MNERPAVLEAIRDVVGPKGWIDDGQAMAPYLAEERGLRRGRCIAVVRPASTAEVARVVALCANAGIAITPQGGNTGLVGGAVAEGGIILSLGRMRRVRALDARNHTLTVEAGCVLAEVQKVAAEAGLLFPLSLGAEGSCQIGGNLSTNAGGVAVLRYGNARDLVLGLEVVLADGRVWDGLRGLRKDNTGYDLKHLFMGAEGTLGVITAAVLKLFPAVRARETAFVAANDLDSLLALLGRAQDACGGALTAFEVLSRRSLEFACRWGEGARDPLAEGHPWYALLELTSPQETAPLKETLESMLADAFAAGEIGDAVIAMSEAQRSELWRLRELIPEAQKHEGASIKHDVSVPVSRVPEFVDRASALVEAELAGVRVVAFGHMGDGNIHFNLNQPEGADSKAFLAEWGRVSRLVHDLVSDMGGSFSAEHGIGALKRDDLMRYKSEVEIDLMRRLKKALDPGGVMNPGKVL